MMSGAWPPPAPSVWKAWMVRPLNALIVSSTKPNSFSVSVWIITCTSWSSATERQQSIAAGVVPQSSCSFSAQAPALTCSTSAAGFEALPLPAKPRFIGNASAASIMRAMCQGPGVQVVAKVPVAGPVPPPSIEVTPRHQRFLDLLRADEMDVGVEAAGGEDLALAGDHLGARPDDDRHAGLDVGIAGLADRMR